MNFIKMHGLGNDFVILDARTAPLDLSDERISQICDRKHGVGCDQLIVMEPRQNEGADLFMRIYNPDASEAEACGNATRCVAHLYMIERAAQACVIETRAGLLHATLTGDHEVEIDMGAPAQIDDVDQGFAGYNNPVTVNMGNPHAVFFVDDLSAVDLETTGPQIETNPYFPNRTNVEFVQVLDKAHLRMRVWERSAGITQACGSGACAVMAAAASRGLSDDTMTLTLDGGDMTMTQTSDGHILMRGAVAYVFEGRLTN
jgi:diaminopimelate epimerase